jgi:hypothetical protein
MLERIGGAKGIEPLTSALRIRGKNLSACLFKSCSHRRKIEVSCSFPFLTIAYPQRAVIFVPRIGQLNPKKLGLCCCGLFLTSLMLSESFASLFQQQPRTTRGRQLSVMYSRGPAVFNPVF